MMESELNSKLPVQNGGGTSTKIALYTAILACFIMGFAVLKSNQYNTELLVQNSQLKNTATIQSSLYNSLNIVNTELISGMRGLLTTDTKSINNNASIVFSQKVELNSTSSNTVLLPTTIYLPHYGRIMNSSSFVNLENINNTKEPRNTDNINALESSSVDELALTNYRFDDLSISSNSEYSNNNKGVYILSGINPKTSDLSTIGGGLYMEIPIKNRFSFNFGLGYLLAKNKDIIQANRGIAIDIKDNANNVIIKSEDIEFNARIKLDNLHYIHLPFNLFYQIQDGLKIGVGVDGRFLVNNYIDHEDSDFNNRFDKFSSTTKRVITPFEYNLRKYAIGFTGTVEVDLRKRIGLFASYYNGLINISGDKVFNTNNNIKNSSIKLGVKYRI